MKVYLFFAVGVVVLGFMNYYIYTRFFARLDISLRIKKLLKYYLIATFLISLFYLISRTKLDDGVLLASSAIFGTTIILFFSTLLYHALFSTLHFNQTRRAFLKKSLDISMVIFALVYLYEGLKTGLSRPKIKQTKLTINDFPFNAFRIVHLSDIHIGKTIKKAFVEDLVARVNQLNPDMIVITGDLSDGYIDDIQAELLPLKNLQSRFGTFMVYGNHEYYYEPFAMQRFLPKLNITLLQNEQIKIHNGEDFFYLCGVLDLAGLRFGFLEPDLFKTFEGIDARKKSILLVHQPRLIKDEEELPVDLILAGHTHAGQIFPFNYLVKLAHKYLHGLYQHSKRAKIYVSAGCGYWGPPMRVFTQSEIAIIDIYA